MKLAIVKSPKLEYSADYIEEQINHLFDSRAVSEVVTCGTYGVEGTIDGIGIEGLRELCARAEGRQDLTFLCEGASFLGTQAVKRRDMQMAKHADAILVFWDGGHQAPVDCAREFSRMRKKAVILLHESPTG